jgi:hypothetical protein
MLSKLFESVFANAKGAVTILPNELIIAPSVEKINMKYFRKIMVIRQ